MTYRKYIDHSVQQGDIEVSLRGKVVMVKDGKKRPYRHKHRHRSDAEADYEAQYDKYIYNALCPKLMAKQNQMSGPDEEGCAGGHCPVR